MKQSHPGGHVVIHPFVSRLLGPSLHVFMPSPNEPFSPSVRRQASVKCYSGHMILAKSFPLFLSFFPTFSHRLHNSGVCVCVWSFITALKSGWLSPGVSPFFFQSVLRGLIYERACSWLGTAGQRAISCQHLLPTSIFQVSLTSKQGF